MQIKIINQNGETLQILKNAYNLKLQDEVFLKTQGSEILSFDIVREEGKSLKNESLLEVNNRVYRVKSITELKGKTLVKHIEAEGLWYELIDKLFAPHLFNDKTISEVITIILENTGWVAGDIIITPARDLLINEEITVLQALSKVQEAYGGIFHFDTKNRTLNVYETIPNEKNLYFQYGKNIVEIEKIINTNNLVTRLYVEGKDGLTIETVNNGIPYIENFNWFIENGFEPEIREYKIKNENITNPQRLLEYAQDRLLDLSKPEISYNVKIAETEELPKLGERVIIRDKDIEMDIESVVIKRDIDLLKPWNSVITLNTKVPGLATQIIQFEEGQITEFDKQPPSPPTNLQLTTVLMNNESYVIANFDSSPQFDVIGYEIAYSYDEEFWETVIVTEPPANVKVTPGKLVFVRVRAYDIEGFKSNWSETKSIISTQDIIPPARPSFVTVEGLFQKVQLEWTKNTEEDFKEYHIQVSGTEDFANILNEYYLSANYMVYSGQTNTTYYFRVSAIDTSLNESDWSHVASATTAAVYDEDIESAIIEEMENNLDTLNNETLPTLQQDLSMLEDISALEIPASFTMLFTTSLQDDISGVVPEGYEPVIRNGDFINTNLNRMISVNETRITQTENDIKLMALDIEGLETNFSQLQVTVNGINATVISQGETLSTHASQIQQLSNQVSFAVAAFDENGNPVTGASLILTADGKIKATADKFILYGDALVNGSITALKLGANSVTANAIGANEIITNVANIKNGVIETAHIKDAAISSAKIADAAITNAKIGTAAVDTANIADLAVTNAKIKDAAITNAKIANLAVDDAKIANLDAAKITSGYIDSDRIEAGSIKANKLEIVPEFAVPESFTMLFTTSLQDDLGGVTPEGYTPVNKNGNIYGGVIEAGSITADKIASNFTISAGQYIQAGTADRNYKLDGTQGLIRTIGSNTYNIYSYVTSGEVNFDGTVTYKDIDLTSYGLTDYIAILNFQQTQFWRSEWTTSKNLTLTYEKISSNILRIFAYFSDDVVWTTKTGPTISFSSGDSWHTLVTTAADTTGAQVYRVATRQNITAESTVTHYYRLPGTYTIKVRGNGIKVLPNNRVNLYMSFDWGDGIITTDGYYVGSEFLQFNFTFKYVAEGHSGNPQPLWGQINYAVLGY